MITHNSISIYSQERTLRRKSETFDELWGELEGGSSSASTSASLTGGGGTGGGGVASANLILGGSGGELPGLQQNTGGKLTLGKSLSFSFFNLKVITFQNAL